MIFQDHISDLFNLIRLPLTVPGLKIENLLNSVLCKNVVIAFDTLIKPKSLEQRTYNVSNDTFASDLRINMCSYNFSSLPISKLYHFCIFMPRCSFYSFAQWQVQWLQWFSRNLVNVNKVGKAKLFKAV